MKGQGVNKEGQRVEGKNARKSAGKGQEGHMFLKSPTVSLPIHGIYAAKQPKHPGRNIERKSSHRG